MYLPISEINLILFGDHCRNLACGPSFRGRQFVSCSWNRSQHLCRKNVKSQRVIFLEVLIGKETVLRGIGVWPLNSYWTLFIPLRWHDVRLGTKHRLRVCIILCVPYKHPHAIFMCTNHIICTYTDVCANTTWASIITKWSNLFSIKKDIECIRDNFISYEIWERFGHMHITKHTEEKGKIMSEKYYYERVSRIYMLRFKNKDFVSFILGFPAISVST